MSQITSSRLPSSSLELPLDGTFVALGMMSGTSLDGVDAALIWTNGHKILETGPYLTHAYPEDFRRRMHAVLGRSDVQSKDVQTVAEELVQHHVDAVVALMTSVPDDWQGVDIIGFHGQTIFHAPQRGQRDGQTVQIGSGRSLSEALQIPVISQFRIDDVAAGGEGAPLVPIYHQALLEGWEERPSGAIAVLNLGGVGNVTLIAEDGNLVAFDTGPGNALIDDWVRLHTGRPCDQGGVLAASGQIQQDWVQHALNHSYFAKTPPKSLDRNDFPSLVEGQMSLVDGAATLTAFTVAAVKKAADILPEKPVCWIICGGGRHNSTLMQGLSQALQSSVINADDLGWQGDALEAQAFGFLAARSVLGLPLTFPGTTGVAEPQRGGHLDHPV